MRPDLQSPIEKPPPHVTKELLQPELEIFDISVLYTGNLLGPTWSGICPPFFIPWIPTENYYSIAISVSAERERSIVTSASGHEFIRWWLRFTFNESGRLAVDKLFPLVNQLSFLIVYGSNSTTPFELKPSPSLSPLFFSAPEYFCLHHSPVKTCESHRATRGIEQTIFRTITLHTGHRILARVSLILISPQQTCQFH